MSNSSPSICIPRVFAEITRRQVKETFAKVLNNEDCIERIDMIRKNRNNDSYQRVFIHFKYWPNGERSTMLKDRLLSGKDIKVAEPTLVFEMVYESCSKTRAQIKSSGRQTFNYIIFC